MAFSVSLFLLRAFFTNTRILSKMMPGMTFSSLVTSSFMMSFKAPTPNMLNTAPGIPCPVQSAVTIILWLFTVAV